MDGAVFTRSAAVMSVGGDALVECGGFPGCKFSVTGGRDPMGADARVLRQQRLGRSLLAGRAWVTVV